MIERCCPSLAFRAPSRNTKACIIPFSTQGPILSTKLDAMFCIPLIRIGRVIRAAISLAQNTKPNLGINTTLMVTRPIITATIPGTKWIGLGW